MGVGLFLIVVGGVMVGVSGAGMAYLAYRLGNDTKRLEAEYENLYGVQPKGPPNRIIATECNYKTFLERAVKQKLTEVELEASYHSFFSKS
jgi:hypothetical protein